MKLRHIAAVIALALTPFAAEARGGGGGAFDKADRNHDGRVTFSEFEAVTSERLMSGSGKGAQKFQQMNPQQRAGMLQRRFDRLDEARKGYLTRADFEAARNARRQHKSL